jgi:hypothetical protein
VAWEEVAYRVEKPDDPPVTEFLTALGRVFVNGGALLRSFRARNKAAFDDALRHDFRGIDHVLRAFLTRPSVVASLPELRIVLPLARPPEFRRISAFGMEGDLTHALLAGGAYERFPGTVNEARASSRGLMEALFGEDLHRIGLAGGSPTPWTPWFHDIAWDATFVVQDRRARRFVLLCMTDTD